MSQSSLFSSTLSLLCILAGIAEANGGANNVTGKVPALFVFGDSIVDPGNNNYINTIFRADFPPYGRDFIDHKPTGRFSNGKLSTDFIASGLGLKETLPPFLDPDLDTQDLITGVSFASAGSGYDNATAKIASVIPMWKQAEFFRDYRVLLEERVGEEKASAIIREAIVLSCTGTNDFIENYNSRPTRRKQFSVTQYQDFLLQILRDFLQEIYNVGARKFGIYGMAPPGCLPEQKTISGQPGLDGCIDKLNQAALGFNTKLKATISGLNAQFPDIKIVYVDIYESFVDIVTNPAKYGFEVSSRGCCATGLIEVGALCSFTSPTCPDASKYVFWDSVHSSEHTYSLTAEMVLERDIPQLL